MISTLLKNINFSKYLFRIFIVLSCLYIILISYSDIRYYRGVDMSWEESIRYTAQNFDISNTFPSNTEFGYAPAITYLLIEKENERFYGGTLISDVLNAIPKINEYMEVEVPSTWFVKKYYPDIYNKGGGLGFTFLGEAYINFGVGFAFLFFFPIIFLIYLIDYISTRSWIYGLISVAMLPSTFLLMRSPFSRFFLEGIIIAGTITFVIYFVLKIFRKKDNKDYNKRRISI